MPGQPRVNAEKVLKLAREGVAAFAIANRLGCSKAVVYRVIREQRREVVRCG